MNIPFGNAIFGILNSDGTKTMRKNGITFWKILFALDWSHNPKIGSITANSTSWNGN